MRNDTEQLERIWERILPDISPEYRSLMEERWVSTIDLFRHSEEELALEILCSNLYEFDVPLDRSTFEELTALSEHYGLKGHLVTDLGELVRGS